MHRKFIPILIMLLGIVTTASVAQTWDATKDFGPSNPNGVWSYGYGITGTSFTLDPLYNPDCFGVSGLVCWILNEDVPDVGFNTTGDWINWRTVVFPPDVLHVHPGPNDGQDSIVQWTAPVAGYYKISGFFEILDTNPTGVIGLVFRNGTLLYRGELLGPPAQHPDQVGGREDFSFSKLFLNAGDVISFAVNKDGDYRFDSTGFNATITRPSTPCALCPPTQAQPFAYVTNSNSGSVSVIATTTNTVVATVGVGDRPVAVGITPDGSRAYVANSNSNSVSVINTASNTVVATVAVESFPQGVAITPDGSRAYVTNTFSNSVSVINTASNTVVATVAVESDPDGVAITPDGSRVYVGNAGSNSVSVIDTASNTVVATVAVGNTPFGVAISPDGSRAYVENIWSDSVSVIDTASNIVIATIGMVQPVSAAVTPDGTRVYVVSNSGTVSVIDTASNTVIATVVIGPYPQAVAITPDGSHAYVASFDSNSIFVIDTATNTVTATVGVGAAPVGVAITPGIGPRQPTKASAGRGR
jgi:YVTN family beta-propeller protein